MKEVDYIVVGLGIAGITFCERLEESGRSYVVFDPGKPNATGIAGGVVNPVLLKHLNPVWRALEFMESATPFYRQLEARLNTSYLSAHKLYRILSNAREQNDWVAGSDSRHLTPFLNPEIIPNTNPNIIAPFGFGEVKKVFKIDTRILLDEFREFLKQTHKIVNEEFQYDQLKKEPDGLQYGDFKAKYIVFSEGSSIVDNPNFSSACLIPKKGEYLTIRCTGLQSDAILKGPFFIIPAAKDLYQVGATFAHGDFTKENTEKGRQQITEAVSKMISCPFEVVGQSHGIRPTVKDRRPILGALSDDRIYFFNGLGTRGLLMAPLLSKWLLDHIENGIALPSEVNIRRFEN